MRIAIALGLLSVACSGLDDDTSGADEKADATAPKIWSFAHVYPDPNSAADVSRMLSLDDLGLRRPFFDAAIGHMFGTYALPGAGAEDRPVSPQDPTILNEACLRNPASWRVTQVRFAPYQLAVPGTVSAYKTWANRSRTRLDQIIELRLSVHPFCTSEDNPGAITREDQALHLIFQIAPEDRMLADAVFASAKGFAADQAVGTATAKERSYVALERHRAALATPAYADFHRRVLEDWLSLAELTEADDDAFTALDTHATSLRRSGLAPVQDRFANPELSDVPSLAHPGLSDAAFAAALAAKIKQYARPAALHHAAMMSTIGTQDPLDDFQETRWFFSVLTPGRYAKLSQMTSAAANVYGSFSPGRLETFVAIAHDRGVDIVRATDAGFYSESRGVFSGPRNVYPSSVRIGSRTVNIKPEVDKVDYKDAVRLDSDQGHDMPLLPTGAPLLAAMKRFADVGVSNATTTPCDRCHNTMNFVREGTATGYRASERHESAYQFHMITSMTSNLRTIRELDAEAARAGAELASH